MRYLLIAPDPETETQAQTPRDGFPGYPPAAIPTEEYTLTPTALFLALLCVGCLLLGGLAYLFFPEMPAECLWGRLRAFAAAFGAAGTFVVAVDGLAR